jgi:hypothetical protein
MGKHKQKKGGGWTGKFSNQNDHIMDRMRDILEKTLNAIIGKQHPDLYEELIFSDVNNIISSNKYYLEALYKETGNEILKMVEQYYQKNLNVIERWNLAIDITGIALAIALYFVDSREAVLSPYHRLPHHYPKWLRKLALASIKERAEILTDYHEQYINKFGEGALNDQMKVIPIEYEFFMS